MKRIMLKILSLIFGISLWYIFSQQRTDSIIIDLPICFYNTIPQVIIHAPETVRVTLSGKRSDLVDLDIKNLAIHLDAHELQNPSTRIALTAEQIFLPATIKLVHYSPAPVPINVLSEDNKS